MNFPRTNTPANPSLPFSIDFVSPRTLRIRATSGPQFAKPPEELMLAGAGGEGRFVAIHQGRRWTPVRQRVRLGDDSGKPVPHRDPGRGGPAADEDRPRTDNARASLRSCLFHLCAARPIIPAAWTRCSRCRRGRRSSAAANRSRGLDKRGQQLVLWTDDANGVQNQGDVQAHSVLS